MKNKIKLFLALALALGLWPLDLAAQVTFPGTPLTPEIHYKNGSEWTLTETPLSTRKRYSFDTAPGDNLVLVKHNLVTGEFFVSATRGQNLQPNVDMTWSVFVYRLP